MALMNNIKTVIMDLAKEFEARGFQDLASSLRLLVNKVKDIEKVSIYTKMMVALIKDLDMKIKAISEKISREGMEELKICVEELLNIFNKTIHNILDSYAKSKLIFVILVALYTITTMRVVALYLMPEVAVPSIIVLLWLSMTILISTLLNLTLTIFIIPTMPLLSITISIAYLKLDSFPTYYFLALHIIALAISMLFITNNVERFKALKMVLLSLENTMTNLINTIKGFTKISMQISITDVGKYTDIYGNETYELIKYINDMQKLAR